MKGLVKTPDVPAQVTPLTQQGLGLYLLRDDPVTHTATSFPTAQVNELDVVQIPRHSAAAALDRPEQSMYEREGKPDLHGRPHRRVAYTLNLDTLNIDAWPPEAGYVGKFSYDQFIKMARGQQIPLAEHANIEVPPTIPAGSMNELPGTSPINLSDLYTW